MHRTPEKIIRTLAREPGLVFTESMPLPRLTTIGTGGKTRLFVQVETLAALKKLMPELEPPWFVLGAGSNLLVSDREFPGVIIRLGRGFRRLRRTGERLSCGAAVALPRLVAAAVDAGFAGFEELSGIPGTLGGAAAMNAGTHLKQLGDLAHRLWMVDTAGVWQSFSRQALRHDYRSSLAPAAGVVTAMTFLRLAGGDPEAQHQRAALLDGQRKVKHPWRRRTFGSTFKNPPGEVAARLIDRAGLKGTCIGGARVSPVHANFIENTGEATSLDVLELIKHVRSEVQRRFGVSLEPEVRLLGFTERELGELAPLAVSRNENLTAETQHITQKKLRG
ncbi:MAG: UDP-N-acetylmuramate dehydrogenase [Candidatus Glassbacteria bacterium]|nr:UDP-N-acetylmuramate dehydrogenase [Candidatus Glassbacteria bacterium]